jgi:arylsulfatase A-like enzyme/Flp pilus assembly protein TadD
MSQRSRFFPIASGAAAVLAAIAWWALRGSGLALPPPNPDQNVLLVTIDTLRADALSSYGGPVPTPTLDQLAARGTRFTFAHAHAVITLVSHTTMLTGRLPYEHGIRDNSGFRVAAGTVTAATRLKAAGFATGAFIGGFPLTKRFGLTPGFDVYDDQLPEMHGVSELSLPERPAEAVVGRALEWIGKQPGRFFGWVHVFDPHAPYRPPPEYSAQFKAQPYYGEVAYVDHALGPLFDRLASLPRPTLVIVTADHGESLGDHGEMTHGMFAYESTLRVPLIVATITPGAGARTPRTVVDASVAHIDILPTILDAVGLAPDPSLRGTSLREAIRTNRGPDRPGYFEAMSYNLSRGWAPLRGVLVGRDKYIDLPLPELYDLVTDPAEQQDLATSRPDRLPALRKTLETLNTAAPNRPGRETAENIAALHALGYVSGSAPARAAYTAADDPKTLAPVDQEVHAAEALYEQGRPDEAIDRMTRVLAKNPTMADAYAYLAYIHWEAGRVGQAIATLESALTHGVTDASLRTRLGLYLAESGSNPQRAVTLLKDLPDTNVEALNGLGVAYTDAGRPADALAAFTKILALDPTNGLAMQNIAAIHLRSALAIADPRDPRRVAALSDAETAVRQALAADPLLPDAYTTLGVILETTGRTAEAIDSWRRAVDLDGREFDALYNLVVELAATGRKDDARRYGQQYLATAPPGLYAKEIAEIRRILGSPEDPVP